MQLRAAALAILLGTGPAAAFELAPTADPLAREIVDTCSAAIAARALPSGDGWQPRLADFAAVRDSALAPCVPFRKSPPG